MALGPFYVAQRLKESSHGTVLLMRHGETAWNREGRVMGRNPVELSPSGRAQVAAAAHWLGDAGIGLIATSPLVRARQSAGIAAALLGNPPIIEDERLSEILYGRWEGMSFNALLEDELYRKYKDNPDTMATPGGETIAAAQMRGVAAVNELMAANRGARVLFVSHGDIIRTVICHFMRLELAHFRRLRIDNASLSTIEVAERFAEVKFINSMPDPARAFISPFRA
ncbi:MAG: histidine phosphatase family protein [Candidatus Binataceae bacterium]